MATEIERKFLLKNDDWREEADAGTRFRQGYLIGAERASVRVRIEGEVANINIKSATLGIQRQEFEYPIPLADATSTTVAAEDDELSMVTLFSTNLWGAAVVVRDA